MVIEIPLSQRGKHKGLYVAFVDDDDEILAELNWNVIISKTTQYASRTTMTNHVRKNYYLHRVVLERMLGVELLPDEEVDHINLNGLDCTRGNLRKATRRQNNTNKGVRRDSKTGVKGVQWREEKQKFYARITFKGTVYRLGYFEKLEDAHAAYCKKADELHEDFANHGRKPDESAGT